jgi:hypothetical protein
MQVEIHANGVPQEPKLHPVYASVPRKRIDAIAGFLRASQDPGGRKWDEVAFPNGGTKIFQWPYVEVRYAVAMSIVADPTCGFVRYLANTMAKRSPTPDFFWGVMVGLFMALEHVADRQVRLYYLHLPEALEHFLCARRKVDAGVAGGHKPHLNTAVRKYIQEKHGSIKGKDHQGYILELLRVCSRVLSRYERCDAGQEDRMQEGDDTQLLVELLITTITYSAFSVPRTFIKLRMLASLYQSRDLFPEVSQAEQ